VVAPNFLQLAEVVKEGGGGRQRKKKKGVEAVRAEKGKWVLLCLNTDGDGNSEVPNSMEGLILEVVLPAIEHTPKFGLVMLLADGEDVGGQQVDAIHAESKKLLEIQQKVGFGYDETNDDVIKVLTNEEQIDRMKEQDWEQRNGYQ
jgi:hypothetical protein